MLAFASQNTDKRKRWLEEYDPRATIDVNSKKLKIYEFFNKEFIHFSINDNMRSIPSLMDGLKPSQRKILYSCFKRNLKN